MRTLLLDTETSTLIWNNALIADQTLVRVRSEMYTGPAGSYRDNQGRYVYQLVEGLGGWMSGSQIVLTSDQMSIEKTQWLA